MQREGAMSLPQFEALYYIANSGEPLMRELAGHLRVQAPTATALIDELARAGHLTRAGDSADRRQVRLKLTAKGKKTLEKAIERKSRMIDDILSVISKKDREQFANLLQAIVSEN